MATRHIHTLAMALCAFALPWRRCNEDNRKQVATHRNINVNTNASLLCSNARRASPMRHNKRMENTEMSCCLHTSLARWSVLNRHIDGASASSIRLQRRLTMKQFPVTISTVTMCSCNAHWEKGVTMTTCDGKECHNIH